MNNHTPIEALNGHCERAPGVGARAILDAILDGMSENEKLLQEARVNSWENFRLGFREALEKEIMRSETTNRAFFERFFSDQEFRNQLIRGVGTEFYRRHSGGRFAA